MFIKNFPVLERLYWFDNITFELDVQVFITTIVIMKSIKASPLMNSVENYTPPYIIWV